MSNLLKGKNVDVMVWSPLEEVESQALEQLKNTSGLPVVFHHIAAMPDVHYGCGATVGSVVALENALIPAAVGVDIACGMICIQTNLTIDDLKAFDLKEIRTSIERTIPTGFNQHKRPAWADSRNEEDVGRLLYDIPTLVSKNADKASLQLGTLGGGNHFIELDADDQGNVYLMLHSGSRNVGKCLADMHIKTAKALDHNTPYGDLAFFIGGTHEFEAYWADLQWAQQYAHFNRMVMTELLIKNLHHYYPTIRIENEVACHHNFVQLEEHFGKRVFVTRKGAIGSDVGEMGIIPGSMGTASYIVRGRGNHDSFCSASHGAGRRMSRGQAKRTFTVEDMEAQMCGIEYQKGSSFLDEIPGAYKDIDQVMFNQRDLVDTVVKLHQILVVKG